MNTENKSCSAKQLQRIEDAFSRGDLDALRQAVDDHGVIPNGRLPHAMGSCFIYAIYRSPLAFIRTLLELGADPNAPVDDGFPSLIAALSGTREQDTARRDRAAQVIGLLLSFGAEPNQRGINDYTPLHMAVAERNPLAAQLLLENGSRRAQSACGATPS